MLLKLIILLFLSTTAFAQNQQPNTVINNIYTGNGYWENNNVGIDTFKPVGIGSTNPGQSLDVNGTVRMKAITISGNNAQNNYVLTATDSSGDATWQSAGAGSQTPWTQNINGAGYQLYSTGNIGVGSANPGQALDVQGTIRASLNIGIGTYNVCTTSGNCPSGGGSVTNVTASSPLQSSGGATPAISIIGSTGSGTNFVLQNSPSLTTPNINVANGTSLVTTGNIGIGTTALNAGLSIMSGNVGIGTWNPVQSLEVNGKVKSTAFVTTGGTSSQFTKGDGSLDSTTYLSSLSGALLATGSVTGATSQSQTFTNAVIANGNLGIGTTPSGASLEVGVAGFDDTGMLGQFTSSTNSYNQVVVQNTSSGASASTNFIVNNNLGTSTAYYGEFGMNSSGFTGTGAWNQPNYVYLDSASADLALGTLANSPIHFFTNSSVNDVMNISGSGNVGIGTTANQSGLSVMNGNVGIGTWSPIQALQVVGTAQATNLTISSIASGTQCLHASSAGVVSGTGSDCGAGGGGSNYWLNDTGNVGINTTYNVGIGTIAANNALTVTGYVSNAYINATEALNQGSQAGGM